MHDTVFSNRYTLIPGLAVFLLMSLALLALPPNALALCVSDADCPNAEVCQNHFCVEPDLPPCSECNCMSSADQLCLEVIEQTCQQTGIYNGSLDCNPVCGDQQCTGSETEETCAADCKLCGSEGICASPILCNECGDWEGPHVDHTPPPTALHDQEIATKYPFRPTGGAPVGKDYDVSIFWTSYHRALNRGTDGGHCDMFCRDKDTPIGLCNHYWGLDGVGLQPDQRDKRAEHQGGARARYINVYRIDGPYQNPEKKWEWPEIQVQEGRFNKYPCSGIVGSRHDWTSRPTPILYAVFRVNGWNGSQWDTDPHYTVRWDEDDAAGNEDFDFSLTPNQPGVIALDRAVETCLKHGQEGRTFTLHRDAALMLCENGNCHDHMFEIWFDVQCRWAPPPPPPSNCTDDQDKVANFCLTQ